jgi:hypothetical protein
MIPPLSGVAFQEDPLGRIWERDASPEPQSYPLGTVEGACGRLGVS